MGDNTPDVILVKRCYKRKHVRDRKWMLRHLENETDIGNRKGGDQMEEDLEEYKRDLEEDAELRKDVNIFRDPAYEEPDIMDDADGALPEIEPDSDEEEDDSPEIPLAELLGGLTIEDANKPVAMPGFTTEVPGGELSDDSDL